MIHVRRSHQDRHAVKRIAAASPLIAGSFCAFLLLSPGEARATSYGCYVTGNWACYPTPQVCYNYGSAPVQSYPSSAACRGKAGIPKASAKRVKKK
jgi:hypothetical protein